MTSSRLNVGYVECYDSARISLLKRAAAKLRDRGIDVVIRARFLTPDRDYLDESFVKWLREEADLILLHIHSSARGYEKIKSLVSSITKPVLAISYGGENLTRNVSQDLYMSFLQYFVEGGIENYANMLILLARAVGKTALSPEPPRRLPWCGIYHPESPRVFEDVREYLDWYRSRFSPSTYVGLLFYRDFWITGNLEVVNALIRELESRGVGVVPVFTWLGLYCQEYVEYCSGESKSMSEDVVTRFFLLDDRPVIDLLISLQDFTLAPRGRGDWVEPTCDSIKLLRKLNVPVLKGLVSYYRTVEEWIRSEEGVDMLSLVMGVCMPELDGVIEPIIVGAAREILDEETGATLKLHVPIPEQIKFLTERVLRWIRLRKKPPEERRVVIVLHNNPCASAETTIGLAFGLDSFESLTRLLRELKRAGYRVEGEPESGEKLAKLILEKRAVPEFRWTPVAEIVRRGGYVDLLDLEEYVKYFRSLPEEVRRKVSEAWGNPEDLLSLNEDELESLTESRDPRRYFTKIALGLYRRKIVIPGIRFGNVVVIPQPKRGCAGARCDGRVCKILHDPTTPPPHQWLAVYRWIEHVFDADVVIHFGTHGYLEFLPGKQCGLSMLCFPQISILHVPHIYLYNVTNPMEGTIAKRRSYAVIVDHMHPPIVLTEKYGHLKELDELLDEYYRAKIGGDESRRRIVFEKIVEVAKKANLYRESMSEDGLIQYLHERLHELTNSTFRDGLHVLGRAPDLDKLALMIVSMLRVDTPTSPSIRRVVAECLGLDYRELLERPHELNRKLKIRNEKALDYVTELSVKLVRELLRRFLSQAS